MHDLTGVGRCALALIFPILSSMGVQVCPVATASLSTHPAGFGEYYMESRTETMEQILRHYRALSVRFSAIYTGFLGEARQVDLISDYIRSIPKAERGFVVIDPVFGDNGGLYETQQTSIIESMRRFITLADLITPNATEAAFLAGEAPRKVLDLATVQRWLTRLDVPKVVITGVTLAEQPGMLCVCGRDGDRCFTYATKKAEGTFHGTGDTFAAVLLGCLLKGLPFEQAMQKAADFVCLCCQTVLDEHIPLCEGLPVEGLLDRI